MKPGAAVFRLSPAQIFVRTPEKIEKNTMQRYIIQIRFRSKRTIDGSRQSTQGFL